MEFLKQFEQHLWKIWKPVILFVMGTGVQLELGSLTFVVPAIVITRLQDI